MGERSPERSSTIEVNLKKRIIIFLTERMILWIIVFLIGFWILLIPFLCKAESPRPWSSDDKQLILWGGLAALADIYTTTQFLNNPYYYEVNPILGRRPDALAVVSYIAAEYLISVTIGYFLPEIEIPIFGKIDLRQQLLYNRASRYTANACWNTRLDWN